MLNLYLNSALKADTFLVNAHEIRIIGNDGCDAATRSTKILIFSLDPTGSPSEKRRFAEEFFMAISPTTDTSKPAE